MSHYNVNRKPAVNPQGPWVNASYELTWAIEEVTPRRKDLIVKIAPDAAYDDSAYDFGGNLIRDDNGEPVAKQHAAITFLETGIVEINPDMLPMHMRNDPADFHPLSRADRKNYPVTWGATVHEAAHANHSMWVPEMNKRILNGELSPDQRNWAGAAMMLEESRIEAYQVDERPQDQMWIEAAVTHVAVEEFSEAANAVAQYRKEHPDADRNELSRYVCGRAAALVLARVDAGSIFRNDKVDAVEGLVRDAFGDRDYDRLREIWQEAHEVADDDGEAMLDLGRRWFELTKDAGDDNQPMGIAISVGESEGEGDSESDAISEALSQNADQAEKEASGQAENERREQRIADKRKAAQTEASQKCQADMKASKVFGAGAGDPQRIGHPVTGYRKPAPQEASLARETRSRLERAYAPEKVTTRITQATPPGKVSMRTMQQRRAQRSMGMLPSAEPFVYMDRRPVTTPPLKVGIIQDVSGSQSDAASAAVSGAWALAKAANDIPGAKVAMVTFGNDVHCIIKPQTRIGKVPVISANAGTYYFIDSLRAIEGELDLTSPGAARLVVILTDGQFAEHDLRYRDTALRRLTEHGVKILWMVTDYGTSYVPEKMPGLHIFTKASGNYSVIPRVICHEAVTALEKQN